MIDLILKEYHHVPVCQICLYSWGRVCYQSLLSILFIWRTRNRFGIISSLYVEMQSQRHCNIFDRMRKYTRFNFINQFQISYEWLHSSRFYIWMNDINLLYQGLHFLVKFRDRTTFWIIVWNIRKIYNHVKMLTFSSE